MEKVIIVTQARIGSTRLPSKVLFPIADDTLLGIHLKRLKKSKIASDIVVATTFEDKAEQIVSIAQQNGVRYFQGSTDNVLDRFYQAVKLEQPDYVVRVTSDCPLIDAALLDKIIEMAIKYKLDYCSNTLIEAYPDGQDVEVIKWRAFKNSWKYAKTKLQLEHVTPFIRENTDFYGKKLFSSMNFPCEEDYSHIRMTVDESDDFNAMELIVNELGIDKNWKTYTQYIIDNPKKFLNQQITRNEGYLKSINQNLQNG